jgi:hypothetical protein
LARDALAGRFQALANIFDCLTKCTAIHSDDNATLAGELAMVGDPNNRPIVLVPTLRTANLYVGIVD